MSLQKLPKKGFKVLRNQRGQGMVEYILLLVIVLAIANAFKGQIMKMINSKTTSVGSGIETFNP
jgi:Flp pilus assembly pilin Flp